MAKLICSLGLAFCREMGMRANVFWRHTTLRWTGGLHFSHRIQFPARDSLFAKTNVVQDSFACQPSPLCHTQSLMRRWQGYVLRRTKTNTRTRSFFAGLAKCNEAPNTRAAFLIALATRVKLQTDTCSSRLGFWSRCHVSTFWAQSTAAYAQERHT